MRRHNSVQVLIGMVNARIGWLTEYTGPLSSPFPFFPFPISPSTIASHTITLISFVQSHRPGVSEARIPLAMEAKFGVVSFF